MKGLLWLILIIVFGVVAFIGGIKRKNRTLVLISIPSFIILIIVIFLVIRNFTGLGWQGTRPTEYIKIPTPR